MCQACAESLIHIALLSSVNSYSILHKVVCYPHFIKQEQNLKNISTSNSRPLLSQTVAANCLDYEEHKICD